MTYGPYQHVDRREVVQAIVASSQLWGAVARNSFAGSIAAVKARLGPLPPHAVGVEFCTDVKPSNGHPTIPWWQDGAAGVQPASRPGYVMIPIRILRYRL